MPTIKAGRGTAPKRVTRPHTYEQNQAANQWRHDRKMRDVEFYGPKLVAARRAGMTWAQIAATYTERKERALKDYHKIYRQQHPDLADPTIDGMALGVMRLNKMSWSEIGAETGLKPETARKRYQTWRKENEETQKRLAAAEEYSKAPTLPEVPTKPETITAPQPEPAKPRLRARKPKAYTVEELRGLFLASGGTEDRWNLLYEAQPVDAIAKHGKSKGWLK